MKPLVLVAAVLALVAGGVCLRAEEPAGPESPPADPTLEEAVDPTPLMALIDPQYAGLVPAVILVTYFLMLIPGLNAIKPWSSMVAVGVGIGLAMATQKSAAWPVAYSGAIVGIAAAVVYKLGHETTAAVPALKKLTNLLPLLLLIVPFLAGCTTAYRLESSGQLAQLANANQKQVDVYHAVYQAQLAAAEADSFSRARERTLRLVAALQAGEPFGESTPAELVDLILLKDTQETQSLKTDVATIATNRANEQDRYNLIGGINQLIVKIAANMAVIAQREMNDLNQLQALAEQYLVDQYRKKEVPSGEGR